MYLIGFLAHSTFSYSKHKVLFLRYSYLPTSLPHSQEIAFSPTSFGRIENTKEEHSPWSVLLREKALSLSDLAS